MRKVRQAGVKTEEQIWKWALGTILLLGLAAGIVIGNDFGASTDEYANAVAGQQSVAAYAGVESEYLDPLVMSDHGPVYFMLWSSGGRLVSRLLPSWTRSDGRHLVNYAVFLCGVAAFFVLSRNLVPSGSAWMATLLFATQPILFGYAFINQKDIPFMVLFIAAVSLGVSATDRFHALAGQDGPVNHPEADNRYGGARDAVAGDWRELSRARKVTLEVLAIACVMTAQDLLRLGWTYSLGSALVKQGYSGTAPALIQHLFSRVAVDAYKTPIELYLNKFDQGYSLLRLVAVPGMGLALLGALALSMPSFRVGLQSLTRGKYPPLLLAGGVLGLAVCVRQIGLFAGALVSLYMVCRLRGRALPALVAYWSLAALMTYATWPYLWPDPIGRFSQSLASVSRFGWLRVLYRGSVVPASELPWHYFPTLASLQLTEPAIALFLTSIPIAILRARSGNVPWALALILGAWIAVPVGGLLLSRATIYDNIRHMLFVVPPMFILAGLSLDALIKRVRSRWAKGGLCLLVLAPGIVGIVAMHPYEYAFFNSFTGGVSGASQQFGTDHWCTSFREAIEVVNERAELGASVVAQRHHGNAKPFARDDLKIVFDEDEIPGAEYILTCTGDGRSEGAEPGFALIYQVKRGEAVFAEVWERQNEGAQTGAE